MHLSVYDFFVQSCFVDEFKGKRVLEVGPGNASVRPLVERFLMPKEYLGVDVVAGRFVDVLLPAERLVEAFGAESFDVVIATELLEHVVDWRSVVGNMKAVLKRGGVIYLTTRSFGYPYHGYLHDLWRFSCEDIARMFLDFKVRALREDSEAPGVFLKAVKGFDDGSCDLSGVEVYSVVLGRRTRGIPDPSDISLARRLRFLLVNGFLVVLNGKFSRVLLK